MVNMAAILMIVMVERCSAFHKSVNNLHVSEDRQNDEQNVDNDDYIFSRMMNIMLIMMITKVERNRPPGGERSVISG